MCKEDLHMKLHQLRAELDVMSAGDRDRSCAESPGTPSGSVAELVPRCASELSAVSSCDVKAGNTCIFFARVPPLVPYEHLHELFSKFGVIKDLNLFRRWATAKTSKGCGTVQYSSTEEAAAALQTLNGVHTFEGYPSYEGPIVVEWMDPARLTSAEAAAAAAAAAKAKQKEAKAAAAKAAAAKAAAAKAAARPRNNSSSRGHAVPAQHSGSLPSWTYLQQLSTLAQHNRALAAAAAGAAADSGPLLPGPLLLPGSCVGGPHPAVEALEVSGWRGGPLSPDSSSSSATCALGDPSSWASLVPVHLLPMMNQAQLPSPAGGFNSNTQMGPLLSPATPPPAAFSHYGLPQLSGQAAAAAAALLAQAAAAAAAAAMSGNHSVSCSMDRLASAAAGGSFGCPTPSIEPWFSGGLQDCSNGSFTAGGSSSLWAAMAAAQEQQQQLQQELEQERLQQQLLPLMLFESIASQGCNTSAPQGCTAAPTGGHTQGQQPHSSGTYALFDSASLIAPLNEADMAAGASAGASHSNHCVNSATHSNSSLSGRQMHNSSTALKTCDVTDFLSGPLGQVRDLTSGPLGQAHLGGSEGYLSMHTRQTGGGVAAAPAANAGCFGGDLFDNNLFDNSSGQQQLAAAGTVTVDVPLSDCSAGQLASHFSNISRLSGAKLQLTSTAEGGTLLRLSGSDPEVGVARSLVQMLSAA